VVWIGTVSSLSIVGPAATDGRCLDAPENRPQEGISVVGKSHHAVDEVNLAETDVVLFFEASRDTPAALNNEEPLNQEVETMVGLNEIRLSDLPIGGSLHIGCHAILRVENWPDVGESPGRSWRSNGPVLGTDMILAHVRYDGEICVGDAVKVVVQ